MARAKVRDFHEPWTAARSKSWESSFRFGPPVESEHVSADAVLSWHVARDRAEAKADWLIWGSRMAGPVPCTGLLGETTTLDPARIVAVSTLAVLPEDSPDAEQFCRRIATCVNACAGVIEPEETISRVRQLLLEMARGEVDSRDDRVVALLARMIPPDQLAKHEATIEGVT